MLRHNPGDRNPRSHRYEEFPTPTPQTFGPLYCLLIASLNNYLGGMLTIMHYNKHALMT